VRIIDENASRAVFLGVSVFVAIITITLIVNFYRVAKDSAAVANRFDISSEYNRQVNEILEKEYITGVEVRYLTNYFVGNEEYKVKVITPDINNNLYTLTFDASFDVDEYWEEDYQKKLDTSIRPNYNYELEIKTVGGINQIKASFRY